MSPLTVDEACGRKRKLDVMRGPLEAAKEVWMKVRDQSVQKLNARIKDKKLLIKDRDALLIRQTYFRAVDAVKAIDENNAYVGLEFPTIFLQSPPVPSAKRRHLGVDEYREDRWYYAPPTPAPAAREVSRADGSLPVSPLIESSSSCSSMPDLDSSPAMEGLSSDLYQPFNTPCTQVTGPCSLDSSLAMEGLSSDLYPPFNTPCTQVTGPCSLPEADPSMSYTSLGSYSEAQLPFRPSPPPSSIPSSPSSCPSSSSASLSPSDAPASPVSSSSQDASPAELSFDVEDPLKNISVEELTMLLKELASRDRVSTPCELVLPADIVTSELPVLPVDDVISLLEAERQPSNTSVDSGQVPFGTGFEDMDCIDFFSIEAQL